MQDLRLAIAKNICDLRTEMDMTQLQLAEILNYSDKAVSKWERGEALPDVTVLKRIADYFGVSVDYLLEFDHKGIIHPARALVRMKQRNRIMITVLAYAAAWLVATVAFAIFVSLDTQFVPWLSFVYALPAGSVVLLVFNSIFGKRKLNFPIASMLLWTTILSFYLSFRLMTPMNLWSLFVVGIPIQFIFVFLPGVGLFRYKTERMKR